MTQVEGINPGDVVATSSFDRLQESATVTISSEPLPADISLPNAP
jgi:multidrug efflux system membrane fusion protein